MLIKDICSSITDGSHNPPLGIETSSYLMLSSKNVFDDEITLDEPRFLSEEDFEKENKRTKVKSGDVLLTIVGTVGRAAVVPNDLPPFTLQRSVAVLHPDETVCSGRYLMYALRGKRSNIETHSKGVAQKGIYLKEVAEIDLPVPSKEIQEQIIEKLDKVNSIIKYRQLEIAKLDDLIKARFVELFGDPVTNEKNWPRLTLGDICEIVSSKRVFEKDYVPSGIPFFRTKEIVELSKGNPISTELFITEEHFAELRKSYGAPKKDDLLISAVGTIGTILIVSGDF